MNRRLSLLALTLMLLGARAHGGVQEFTDKDEWIAAVGDFATVDFTGFDVGTIITDQYADLGILFTDGNDRIQHTASFVNDEWGLDGNGDIRVAFDTPQLWIGVDFPGGMRFELFSDGRLIFTSFDYVPGGHGNFFGLLSNESFDVVVLGDIGGFEAEIDDLHFGPPGPGNCPWDLDDDDDVGVSDLLALLTQWGADPDGPPDFDDDGNVGVSDLLALLANWGPCP